VAAIFRDLADGRVGGPEAAHALAAVRPGRLSDGYLRGLPGMRRLAEAD